MGIREVNRLNYKVDKTKSLKKNKIDKSLAKIYHIKKRKYIHYQYQEWERRQHYRLYKYWKGIRENHEPIYTNKWTT